MSQFYVGVSDGNLPPDVPTQFTTDDGAIVKPLLHNLNVFGGVGANTTGNVGTGTININIINQGFTWSEKSTDFNAVVENGYFCTSGLTVTLPVTAGLTIGNTIIIYCDTASSVIVQCQSDQTIQIGTGTSSIGGTADSNNFGDCIELVFRPSDATWHSISTTGTWITG